MTLRVTLEIVPFGVESRKRVIDLIEIHNVGHTADPPDVPDEIGGVVCDYRVNAYTNGDRSKPEEEYFLHGYPRNLGARTLLMLALMALCTEERREQLEKFMEA